ncbi:hypothetical protein PIN31115_02064 [Pandoraea iniqua]|uniref:Uncharacterized protein n=1 Tax=Pandoraea iniqua TaxID=2508288 RepID=A0A5E4UJV8_9BURK|nr:hypothetical protein [Pandoraea iniqua]VVE00206.1 hypothetical protein PIN31115_02064 [Pandoraea iniqua]
MSDIVTNAQDSGPKWACAAHGCMLAGTTRTGADWLCGCHAHVMPMHWQEVTARMHARSAFVKAYLNAATIHPFDWANGRHRAASDAMARIGRPDLAPANQIRTTKVFDRKAHAFVEHTRTINEQDSVKLWTERLYLTLIAECCADLDKAKVRTLPSAELPFTPPAIQSLIPEMIE